MCWIKSAFSVTARHFRVSCTFFCLCSFLHYLFSFKVMVCPTHPQQPCTGKIIGSTVGQIAINQLDASVLYLQKLFLGESLTVFMSTQDMKLQPLCVHSWSFKVNGVAFYSVIIQSLCCNSTLVHTEWHSIAFGL